MSLNKWKVWPVENSEDVLKIEKKLVTIKRGTHDQFLAKIKFFEPGKAYDHENTEDVLKIEKKLVTTKIGSCDKFLAKIKFFEPGKAE